MNPSVNKDQRGTVKNDQKGKNFTMGK